MEVNTRPGAPSIAGSLTSVPKQYRQLMHRNNASKSPTPATQKGRPCVPHEPQLMLLWSCVAKTDDSPNSTLNIHAQIQTRRSKPQPV